MHAEKIAKDAISLTFKASYGTDLNLVSGGGCLGQRRKRREYWKDDVELADARLPLIVSSLPMRI